MKKIERNDPCPCGSGKKYKQCCLKQDEALATSQRVETNALASLLQTALTHYQAGRHVEAEARYQQVLQINPQHPEALHLLGIITYQTGRLEPALEYLQRALTANPQFPEAFNTHGLVLQAGGKIEAAAASYLQAIALNPRYAEAHNNWGNLLKLQGKLNEARVSFQKAIELNPRFAQAHNNLGNVLKEQNKLNEAAASYATAIAINPQYANAYYNLGFVFYTQRKLDAAAENYRQAIALKADFADAYYNLANVLQAQHKIEAAVECYQQALVFRPSYVEAMNNLGAAFQSKGALDKAEKMYQQAALLKPDYADAYNNLGNVFKDQGRLDEAFSNFRHALSIKPDYIEARSNLLYTMIFDRTLSREAVFQSAQEYALLVEQPLRSTWQPHSNDKNPARRLRIGYVSPDFRNHAVAYFAEPILSHHDKTQVDVYCYAEVMLEDDVTHRFQTYADHWHSTVGLSDQAMAQLIREHQIDILIDLAGHTAKNRLPVFARKPAPIQMTYVGYPGTTGLKAMDYRITDIYADPVGVADAFYSEQLLRLPHSLWCYRPSADMPEVTPLPALERGYMTFGSFNNFNKIDQLTLELWSELLRSIPTARLMMLTVPEGESRDRLQQRFAELGVESSRLEFHGKMPGPEFHRKFLEVDVTLDPVTVNGATTSCESLWMGVPVMSLVGERFLTRAGLSILSTVGFNDFASSSREDFIHLGIHLANNLPLLAEIRAELRDHLRSSPLVNELDFTRHLESRLREVWSIWCNANNHE